MLVIVVDVDTFVIVSFCHLQKFLVISIRCTKLFFLFLNRYLRYDTNVCTALYIYFYTFTEKVKVFASNEVF